MQGIIQKENTDKALKYGIYRHLPTYEKIIRNLVSFYYKDYISKHYSEERLSIKEIGDHVFLSASYICTYFKTQTGQTLNQYITEYRMERAMQLLQDKRYAITDISEKVGYNNGNYFGKSFKKFTGLTPSQYRDKMLG